MSSNTYNPFTGFNGGDSQGNKNNNWTVVDTKALGKAKPAKAARHAHSQEDKESKKVDLDFSKTSNALVSQEEAKKWRAEHHITILDPYNNNNYDASNESDGGNNTVPPPLTEFTMLETFIKFINNNKGKEKEENEIQYNHFPHFLFEKLKQLNFTAPTPIQAQSWSFLLLLKDFVGIAKTGSGKTFSFMVPSIIFVWNILKDNNAGGGRRDALPGPYVLVLAPTRELAQQIESETRKILPTVAEANAGGNRQQHQQLIQCSCIFGGAPKGQQINELRAGVHILIATPGRLIDFLHIQKVNLSNTLFFILDEADRMLDMGFEPQVKEIHSHLIQGGEGEAKSYDNKKNLLSLMFSATWPKEIQNMAKYFLKRDFLRVNIGSTELLANKDVKQSFIHVQQENYKLDELKRILLEKKQEINKHNLADGRILIFVKTKKTADFLEFQLKKLSYDCMAIHGDKEQRQREYIMDCFKRGTVDEKKGSSSTAGSNVQKKNHMILVATDVAARGLDIKKLKLVINYDFPMQIDDYVHRIGRTGRAGEKGESITFITKKEDCFTTNINNIANLLGIVERAQGKEGVPEWMREWAAYYHLSADNAGSGEKGGTTKYNYVYSGTKRNKNMGANFDGRGGPQLMLPNTGKKNFFGLGGDSGSTANYGTSTSVRKFSSSDEDEDDRPVKRAKK